MVTREWFVRAKPYPYPRDGFLYQDLNGPFNSAVDAARFAERERPVDRFSHVSIISKVNRKKGYSINA